MANSSDYTISGICDPVVKPGRTGARSEFTRSVLDLPVGKAVIISGMTVSNAASRAHTIGSKQEPRRKFSAAQLDDGRIQLVRMA